MPALYFVNTARFSTDLWLTPYARVLVRHKPADRLTDFVFTLTHVTSQACYVVTPFWVAFMIRTA